METMKIFITGVNGFIGNALAEKLLRDSRCEICGIDINSYNVERFFHHKRFTFKKADICKNHKWIEAQIAKSNVVIPLAALVVPIEYVREPLKVFELDFEENLKIVRYCLKHKKRLVFPSTSEVYGMCDEEVFNEEVSKLILGPVRIQRWIYSCCKQLLERVIWAYGKEHKLNFTIFRPFNWIGPRLDTLDAARNKNSRVVTQFILNLVEGQPIQLVDSGGQKRCFMDISDGVKCLLKIIENKNNVCDGKIFNIGNPKNEISIKELAQILIKKFKSHLLYKKFPKPAGIKTVKSADFYGKDYQDISRRKPCIKNVRKFLRCSPSVTLSESLDKALDYFLSNT